LSHAFAISDPIMEGRLPEKPSKEEKIARAKMLYSIDTPVSQIRKDIGVRSRTTVYKYIAMPENNVQ